jgi:DNA-binding NtrC family response regulator
VIRHTVLVVDDEKNVLSSVSRMLSVEGYDVLKASSGAEASTLVQAHHIDLALLDVKMPGMDGLELLGALLSREPDLPIVMMSAHATIETAVRATQAGARDFLEKPLSTEKVLVVLQNALRISDLERETATLRASVEPDRELVGSGAAMIRVKQLLARVAPTEGRVLLSGESGTGKELAARAIHRMSTRSSGPFVTVNCAAIPSELFESELFGHEKGAFTGASRSRSGKFEQAHRGTLLLDEIGDMPLAMQAKLLRVLETSEIERVGGAGSRKVDVRVIAATNKDLARNVIKGEFREDLFHRLNVVPIRLPALREKMEDFPELVSHALQNLSRIHGKKPRQIDREAMERLRARPWPGNVRELKNALERLVILSPEAVIRAEDVDLYLPPPPAPLEIPASAGSGTLKDRMRELERLLIEKSLDAHKGNVTATARTLGLERSHLYKKMKELGVERDEAPAGGSST